MVQEEAKRISKVEKGLKYMATKTPTQLVTSSGLAEQKVTEMMEWFVSLEAEQQQSFI